MAQAWSSNRTATSAGTISALDMAATGSTHRMAKASEIKRLRRMAQAGTVSLAEADRALGRSGGFARYWSRVLGLRFARGAIPLIERLACHRNDMR